MQTFNNLHIASLDGSHLLGNVLALTSQIVCMEQHIGYLRIVRETLARCGRNDVYATLIRPDDLSYLLKLFSAGKRTAAKLYNLFHS